MRRLIALAVGLVLSTLLLGGGWLLSTLRERETRMRESQEQLLRTTGAVRAAIDESLEELRAREDARPFYLYNYYYSPPDVLAISDPIAVSPLAHPPRDERLIGHFQIEPGGVVRTPYQAEGNETPAIAARITTILAQDALPRLRDLAHGEAVGTMLRPTLRQPPPQTDGGSIVRHRRPVSRRPADPEPIRTESAELEGDAVATAEDTNTNNDSLALNLNAFSMTQAADITAAQAGDPEANARVLERGRQVPRINRRDVSLEEMQQAWNSEPQMHGSGASTGAPPQAQSAPRQRPQSQHRSQPEPEPIEPEPDLVYGNFDNAVQHETEVDYTPMEYEQFGDTLILHRVISHEGASVVQGVVLDRERLVGEWIPALVARHGEERSPSVVTAPNARCAVRQPASTVLDGVDLCFPPEVLTASTASIDEELRYQLGGLIALLLVTLIAAWSIVQTARRAEALSQQKSAFVSAVSHELRTPLTTLRMHAEMLEEGIVSDARLPKVHGEMVRESVRLSRLIDNVLSISKLEQGRRPIRTAEGDLLAHVREIVEGQRRFVEDRGFSLHAPEEGEPLTARFDSQAVDQIVVNLLDNAVKYGGGKTNEIDVWVGLQNNVPTITVSDRGPGIPENERTRVFDRFHRVETIAQSHAPGTGIGLALVKELTEGHNGTASVHPREGGGLEVRIRLGA